MRRPPRPCSHPGCAALVERGACALHGRAQQRDADARRGSATARGYDGRWRRYRARYLAEHPLCRECETRGRTTAATVVDHVEPHRGDHRLFWDPKNHQPLCGTCHSRKTARQDGGFGNRRTGALT